MTPAGSWPQGALFGISEGVECSESRRFHTTTPPLSPSTADLGVSQPWGFPRSSQASHVCSHAGPCSSTAHTSAVMHVHAIQLLMPLVPCQESLVLFPMLLEPIFPASLRGNTKSIHVYTERRTRHPACFLQGPVPGGGTTGPKGKVSACGCSARGRTGSLGWKGRARLHVPPPPFLVAFMCLQPCQNLSCLW